MSNKTRLQNNNTAIDNNNIDLQTLLNSINSLPEATEAINLDEEITEQENLIVSQDTVIADIVNALEGKASGGSSAKTTKIIYLDWSEDDEMTCEIRYVSNGEIVTIWAGNNIESIEADGGIVLLNNDSGMCNWTSNFIDFYNDSSNGHKVLIAKQDGETIYLVSSSEQV